MVRRGCGSSRRTRRARRCAGGARRSGTSSARLPSIEKHDVGNQSEAENDRRDPGHFDEVESPWVKCHAATFGGSRAAVLIQIIGLRQYNAAQNKLGVVSLLLSLLLTAVIVGPVLLLAG